MKTRTAILLSILSAGLLFAQKPPRQAEPQSEAALPAADAKLDGEIRASLFPLMLQVSPQLFSRRVLPSQERTRIDYVMLSGPNAEVIPLQLTMKRGSSAPVHYARARFDRKNKRLEIKYAHPTTGKISWLPAVEWHEKTRPIS